jgi:hypothetical protein
MSAELVGATAEICCCAACGIAALALDNVNVKLKKCGCKLVQYCSVDCQKNHRPQHKRVCKKRLAEIRDDELFTQPEISQYGECPICCLPIPIDDNKSKLNSCCCKIFCNGCNYANKKREWEQGLEYKCPYCREPVPDTEEEIDENLMRRIKANDPIALNEMGVKRHNTMKGTMKKRLNIIQRRLDWGMRMRITIYPLCIQRGKVLRGI